jgi:three-Cys-motif partner protein
LNASVPNFQSDGLTITATEPWFKVKVQLIQSYLQAFIINAFPKADELIFVDLFSGSGLYSVGHQKDVFPGACLNALSSDLPFHRWIFCESNAEQATALDGRIKRFFPKMNVDVLNILEENFFQTLNNAIPGSKAGHRVAVVCLIDPFSIEIPLATVDKLASAGFSLLIPFTFPLNDRLDCRYYCDEQAEALKRFIGAGNYEKLKTLDNNVHFYRKLVQLYQSGLLVKGLNSALSSHKLNSKLMMLQSYSVGFFSRQFSAQAIQRDVNVSEHLQFDLFSA